MKKLLLILALGSFTIDCGGKAPPNLTPAQTTAYYGYKALAEANIAVDAIVQLEAAKTPGFTEDKVAKVVIASYTANDEGGKLAGLLEEYDKITDPALKLTKIEAINAKIALFEKAAKELAGVDFGTSLPATITKTIQLIFDSINQLKAMIAAVKTTAVLAPVSFSAQPVQVS